MVKPKLLFTSLLPAAQAFTIVVPRHATTVQRQLVNMRLSPYSGGCGPFWMPSAAGCLVPRSGVSPWRDMARELTQFQRDYLEPLQGLRTLADVALAPEVAETDEGYVLSFKLGGLQEKDVTISLTDRLLTLRADASALGEDAYGPVRWSLRNSGRVQRSFVIPEGAGSSGARSAWEDGTLKIMLPKRAADAASVPADGEATLAAEPGAPPSSAPGTASTSDYLSSLSGGQQPQQQDKQQPPVAVPPSATVSSAAAVSPSAAAPTPQRPQTIWSLLEEIDAEMREADRRAWQARADAAAVAAERRRARLAEQRREMMAVDISQATPASAGYEVTVELPRGAERTDVTLAVMPALEVARTERGVLEVTVKGRGVRRVALPADADVAAIKARFTPEAVAPEAALTSGDDAAAAEVAAAAPAEAADLVSRLVVSVPRVMPTPPVTIAIE